MMMNWFYVTIFYDDSSYGDGIILCNTMELFSQYNIFSMFRFDNVDVNNVWCMYYDFVVNSL